MNQEKLIRKLATQRDTLFILAIVVSIIAVAVSVITVSRIGQCSYPGDFFRGEAEHADIKI